MAARCLMVFKADKKGRSNQQFVHKGSKLRRFETQTNRCIEALDNLRPEGRISVLRENLHCGFVYWMSEQALSCSRCSLFLVVPEEFGRSRRTRSSRPCGHARNSETWSVSLARSCQLTKELRCKFHLVCSRMFQRCSRICTSAGLSLSSRHNLASLLSTGGPRASPKSSPVNPLGRRASDG